MANFTKIKTKGKIEDRRGEYSVRLEDGSVRRYRTKAEYQQKHLGKKPPSPRPTPSKKAPTSLVKSKRR